LASSRAS